MQFILATNVDLNEYEDEKYIYIIHLSFASQNIWKCSYLCNLEGGS
jgi:hypothetical protein